MTLAATLLTTSTWSSTTPPKARPATKRCRSRRLVWTTIRLYRATPSLAWDRTFPVPGRWAKRWGRRIATSCGLILINAKHQRKEDTNRKYSKRYRYIGLGAVGLGGLYMMMRRRNPNSNKSNMTQPGDLAAQKPAESQMERVLGRGR